MRKHGWQLPYHPLQVVAIAVFLALGFAFYVFFLPFVGRRNFQYIIMGLYTPLITCVFCLYIWCAAADPGDPGIFKSKKYLKTVDNGKHMHSMESTLPGETTSTIPDANDVTIGEKTLDQREVGMDTARESGSSEIGNNVSSHHKSWHMVLLGWCPCALLYACSRRHEESPAQQMSEDGMFSCSLCEVEVFKNSKHCRVCDKCVDNFDHHCRWLNNCVGKKNYRQFFTLMVSALILLILQWSTGILVLICCMLERKRFSGEITNKLGSSFSFAPFVVVVGSCTILAMIATLPLAQLFFFHVLLIKKGISTYDYIIALREQEQQLAGGQQSPQMSPASSLTGLSSASSFNTFNRAAWCTPPRLFLEDQFDVVPPDTGMHLNSSVKRMVGEQSTRKKNPKAVKMNPWTLARLNADEVAKVAAEAKKRSKILQPVVRKDLPSGLETDSSFDSSGRIVPRPDSRRRQSKRVRVPVDLPLGSLAKVSAKSGEFHPTGLVTETSTSFAPLQLEARSAFRTSRAMSAASSNIVSSPESSLDSPNIHPFRVSSSGAEEARGLTGLTTGGSSTHKGILLTRSTSDGYEASGGEDSDQVPSRILHRTTNWSKLLFNSSHNDWAVKLNASHNDWAVKSNASSSTSVANSRKF